MSVPSLLYRKSLLNFCFEAAISCLDNSDCSASESRLTWRASLGCHTKNRPSKSRWRKGHIVLPGTSKRICYGEITVGAIVVFIYWFLFYFVMLFLFCFYPLYLQRQNVGMITFQTYSVISDSNLKCGKRMRKWRNGAWPPTSGLKCRIANLRRLRYTACVRLHQQNEVG